MRKQELAAIGAMLCAVSVLTGAFAVRHKQEQSVVRQEPTCTLAAQVTEANRQENPAVAPTTATDPPAVTRIAPNRQTRADTEKRTVRADEPMTVPSRKDATATQPAPDAVTPTDRKWGTKGDLDPEVFERELRAYAETFRYVEIDPTLRRNNSSWTFNECTSCYRNQADFRKGIESCIEFEIQRSMDARNTGEGDPILMNIQVELTYDEAYEDEYYTCYVLYLD